MRAVHLSLTDDASELLDKYCTSRSRGNFLSQLVVDYHRSQLDGVGVVDALRKRAKAAAAESEKAAAALRAVEALNGFQRGGKHGK